jgi:hypothetical protein
MDNAFCRGCGCTFIPTRRTQLYHLRSCGIDARRRMRLGTFSPPVVSWRKRILACVDPKTHTYHSPPQKGAVTA